MKIPVEVVGVRVEMPSNQPIILLKEIAGIRYLPIWVGAVEATAIAFAQQSVLPPRPLTHDLYLETLKTLGVDIAKAEIVEMVEGIFHATLFLSDGQSVSARPSDALALALKSGAPILVLEDLFAQAGIEIPESDRDFSSLPLLDDESDGVLGSEAGSGAQSGGAEVEVERFREFLDQINPDDFLG